MQLIYSTAAVTIVLVMIFTLSKRVLIVPNDNIYMYNKNIFIAIIAVLIFVSAFRNNFIDTYIYRLMYERAANNWAYVVEDMKNTEFGFRFFMYLLNFISKDSQFLLIITSILINSCFAYVVYKYSEDVSLSIFLYFVNIYMGTMNVIRQSIVAAILFLAFKWIEEKKTISYILLVLLLSFIHQSAVFFIPLYFIVRGRKLNIGIIGVVLLAISCYFLPSSIFRVLEEFLGDSKYTSYLVLGGRGANIVRAIVDAVPCIMGLFYIKLQSVNGRKIDKRIEILINYSFINFSVMLMATKMVYFSRMSIYFAWFNLLLIPYLINHMFGKKDKLIIKYTTYVLYGVYFIYVVRSFGNYIKSFYLIIGS